LGENDKQVHVLVATSGDTGSAVANGFLGVEGIHVHVLYPKGKVSKISGVAVYHARSKYYCTGSGRNFRRLPAFGQNIFSGRGTE
jgi:hypothetical protein